MKVIVAAVVLRYASFGKVWMYIGRLSLYICNKICCKDNKWCLKVRNMVGRAYTEEKGGVLAIDEASC
jgi:hypothetical protein